MVTFSGSLHISGVGLHLGIDLHYLPFKARRRLVLILVTDNIYRPGKDPCACAAGSQVCLTLYFTCMPLVVYAADS